jgi:hypothetical protein
MLEFVAMINKMPFVLWHFILTLSGFGTQNIHMYFLADMLVSFNAFLSYADVYCMLTVRLLVDLHKGTEESLLERGWLEFTRLSFTQAA